jgi:hypothetical protein
MYVCADEPIYAEVVSLYQQNCGLVLPPLVVNPGTIPFNLYVLPAVNVICPVDVFGDITLPELASKTLQTTTEPLDKLVCDAVLVYFIKFVLVVPVAVA